MCLNYLATVEPYTPLPDTTNICPNFQACYDNCRVTGGAILGSPTICSLRCSGAEGEGCAQCVVPALGQCVALDCPQELGFFADCMESCSLEEDRDGCAANRCQAQILSLNACAEPGIVAGACDSFTQVCGADL